MDLTKQPPRRPSNTGMAGLAGMARMTDKARAHNAETLGEYLYGEKSGLDREVLEFLGMSADDFATAADTLDDADLSALVLERAKKSQAAIDTFNKEHLERLPQDDRHRQLLKERLAKYAPGRTDVTTVFQSIELDDWGLFRQVDLSKRPARSPYIRSVAGVYGAARMADKARAYKSGLMGEYKYGDDSGLDEVILEFLGIAAADFATAAYANPNDIELSEWVRAHTTRTQAQIATFNVRRATRGLNVPETREFFLELRDKMCPERTDLCAFGELLDHDDQQSFGIVDLTRRAPRNPYDDSIGGITSLARMIDKGRAFNAGSLGAYFFGGDSGIDRGILDFLGVSQEDFVAALKTHPTDEAVAQWLGTRLQKPQAAIDEFNEKMRNYGPTNERQWSFLRREVARNDPGRKDITSFFAMMALDDAVTFARLKAGV